MTTGKERRVPEGALGPCFEALETSYEVHAPGFDVTASLAAREVRGVEPKGPAAAAGLRNGDVPRLGNAPRAGIPPQGCPR